MFSQANQQPMLDYDDDVLYGSRQEALKAIERKKAGNTSECVIYTIKTFADKKQWRVLDLIAGDKRVRSMFSGMNIGHSLPMQSFSWPKLNDSKFPTVFIAPEGTGKTYAHLLYTISRCILDEPASKTDEMIAHENGFTHTVDETCQVDDLIAHPKYIIICSSQYQVEVLLRHAEKIKEKAYTPTATVARCRSLPPIVKSVDVNHEQNKLMLRCSESQILVGTPSVLSKCFEAGYLNFKRCKRVIFDDLDLALQLHNYTIRELIKVYLAQTQVKKTRSAVVAPTCVFHSFARKWTDLVKQFVGNVFPQVILVFGSLAEAGIYTNLKFELEIIKPKTDKLYKLATFIQVDHLMSHLNHRIAIVCNSNAEARLISSKLGELNFDNQLYVVEDPTDHQPRARLNKRKRGKMLFVMTDEALVFEVESLMSSDPLHDITHLIHYSMPEDLITFDQRFKLMSKNIQNEEKLLISTLMIEEGFPRKEAKHLYDLFSRSTSTSNSAKLQIKNHVSNNNDSICWRWATTGHCKLEKLHKEDKFGIYCPDRHSISNVEKKRFPTTGQCRITITHVVSPSEFYFWFEAHRGSKSSVWTNYRSTGTRYMNELQIELDRYRSAQLRSVPLNAIRKGRIFGVYFHQEARVDRVLLLDEPKHDTSEQESNNTNGSSRAKKTSTVNVTLELTKQVPVYKIDYGCRVEVFVKNLILLPESLTSIEPQCHRGFNLGIKPTDNEPYWIYKSKKAFIEATSRSPSQKISVWLRLNSDGCFWFSNLEVSVQFANLGSGEVIVKQPNRELVNDELAVMVYNEPLFVDPCERDATMSKWHSNSLRAHTQITTIRPDEKILDIYLLDIKRNMDVIFRKAKFNKLLINLEDDLAKDFAQGKLVPQEYLEKGVVCLVQMDDANETKCTFNRAVIQKVVEMDESLTSIDQETRTKVCVRFPDHGDESVASKKRLFQIPLQRLKQLPFQAIRAPLAYVKKDIVEDLKLNMKTRNLILDWTRGENNQLKRIKCRPDKDGHLYLYVRTEEKSKFFQEVSHVLNTLNKIALHPSASFGAYYYGIYDEACDNIDESAAVTPGDCENFFRTVMFSAVEEMIYKEFDKASFDAKKNLNDDEDDSMTEIDSDS